MESEVAVQTQRTKTICVAEKKIQEGGFQTFSADACG